MFIYFCFFFVVVVQCQSQRRNNRQSLPIQLPQPLSQQLLPFSFHVMQQQATHVPLMENMQTPNNYCTLPRQWLEEMARFHSQLQTQTQLQQHHQQQHQQQ